MVPAFPGFLTVSLAEAQPPLTLRLPLSASLFSATAAGCCCCPHVPEQSDSTQQNGKEFLDMLLSYPITTEDLLALLYPHGRLRTSRAYQGANPLTNWKQFAQEQESSQVRTEAAPALRASSDTVVALSPAESSERTCVRRSLARSQTIVASMK